MADIKSGSWTETNFEFVEKEYIYIYIYTHQPLEEYHSHRRVVCKGGFRSLPTNEQLSKHDSEMISRDVKHTGEDP